MPKRSKLDVLTMVGQVLRLRDAYAAEEEPRDAEPGPCHGCARSERCAQARMACEAFAAFVHYGREERWRLAPRAPSADIYRRIYGRAAARQSRMQAERWRAQSA